MKKSIAIAVIVVGALLMGSLLLNFAVQLAIEGVASRAAHVPVRIGSTELHLFKGSIALKGLRVLNPHGFPERLMLEAPLVAITCDVSTLFGGVPHLREVRLNLKELTVIKRQDGTLNVDAVKPGQKTTGQTDKSDPFTIDDLYLSVGKVVYKDYSAGQSPAVQIFDINMQDRHFTHITNAGSLVSLIMFEALTKTTLSRLAGLDLNVFKEGATNTLATGLGLIKGGSSEAGDTVKGILNLFK